MTNSTPRKLTVFALAMFCCDPASAQQDLCRPDANGNYTLQCVRERFIEGFVAGCLAGGSSARTNLIVLNSAGYPLVEGDFTSNSISCTVQPGTLTTGNSGVGLGFSGSIVNPFDASALAKKLNDFPMTRGLMSRP